MCTFLTLFLLVQPQVPHCSKWDTSCYQCFSRLILGDGFWFLGSLFGTPLEISKGFPNRESGIHVESRRQLGYLEQETKIPIKDSLLRPGHPFGVIIFCSKPILVSYTKDSPQRPSVECMKIGSMLRMFSASQTGRYRINRHVAGGANGVSRHDKTASSGSITMVNPLREA